MSDKFPWKKSENQLNFSVIRDTLDRLVLSVEIQIERRWPDALGGVQGRQLPLAWMVKNARWINRASRHMLADHPPDPERKLEFTVAARPLNRVILDMVFNVVYIFDDFPERLCSYALAGLDQHRKQDERYVQRFSGVPVWDDWLRQLQATWTNNEALRSEWSRWQPNAKSYFPYPGRMVSEGFQKQWKNVDSLRFLEYLDAEYYRELSSAAHGQWYGLMFSVVQPLRLESRDADQEEFARKEKSDLVIQQILFLMCLVTELLTFGKLDGTDRAAFLWTLLSGYSGWTEEIYKMRYQSRLSP